MQIELVGTAKTPGCSGVIFAHPNYKAEQKALFLTNSHCLKSDNKGQLYMSPEEVIWDLDFSNNLSVHLPKSGMFYGNLLKSLQTKKILFASISGRDIALIELEYTYKKLMEDLQIEPYLLSRSTGLKVGDQLDILGSYHEEIHKCTFDHFTENFIAAGPYLWTDALVLKNCLPKTRSGVSGAGVILAGTRNLIALHNSSNYSEKNECDTSNACEYDKLGINISRKYDAYSQNLDFLFSCFNENFEMDTKSCELAF